MLQNKVSCLFCKPSVTIAIQQLFWRREKQATFISPKSEGMLLCSVKSHFNKVSPCFESLNSTSMDVTHGSKSGKFQGQCWIEHIWCRWRHGILGIGLWWLLKAVTEYLACHLRRLGTSFSRICLLWSWCYLPLSAKLNRLMGSGSCLFPYVWDLSVWKELSEICRSERREHL